MLIRRAEIHDSTISDVRIADGRIAAFGRFEALPGEPVIDAAGGALLPGLHDHHVHLLATAAESGSIRCDRHSVGCEQGLADALSKPGTGWLRGILYDESIAGMLDADRLDEMVPERPVRIQDRTGRLWVLNRLAISLLLERAPPPPGLERVDGRWTGRLFDSDSWLREALDSTPPALDEVGARLVACGVTGVTDLTPGNGQTELRHLESEQRRGALPLRCLVGGRAALAEGAFTGRVELGPLKVHLHEASLPDFDETISLVRLAHDQGRATAFHCVTEVELVFALSAIRDAATDGVSRIEHGALVSDALAPEIAELGCPVVTQPHFIAERGDRYLATVDRDDLPNLYRLAGLARHGITLAGGSDSPWGSIDPWAAMRAAVSRRTSTGVPIGETESLSPEQALALFLKHPHDLTRERRIEPGAAADLCLLDRPWSSARSRLDAGDVRATLIGGSVVHESVDQPPIERRLGTDPAAREDHEVGALAADPAA